MTTRATDQPAAPAPRRERPASLPPATPEDLAQSQRIWEATGCAVSVVTGVLGAWDLFARSRRIVAAVVVARGQRTPDLLGVQYYGAGGWPADVLRVLHWYRGDAAWPEAHLL